MDSRYRGRCGASQTQGEFPVTVWHHPYSMIGCLYLSTWPEGSPCGDRKPPRVMFLTPYLGGQGADDLLVFILAF